MSKDFESEFREWTLARRGGLRRTAFLLCGDWHLADDLVQETLTRLYAVWPRVTKTGEPDAYARRILVNLSIDHQRRPARREQPSPTLPDRATSETDSSETISVGNRDLVIRGLQEVPPGQRAVLVLRFWEDLSVEQTANVLNTSTGNVKSQTSRGLSTLRDALTAQGLPAISIAKEQP